MKKLLSIQIIAWALLPITIAMFGMERQNIEIPDWKAVEIQSSFITLVLQGNVTSAEELLTANPWLNVNRKALLIDTQKKYVHYDKTLLHCVVEKGDLPAVQFLLKQSNIDINTNTGCSNLIFMDNRFNPTTPLASALICKCSVPICSHKSIAKALVMHQNFNPNHKYSSEFPLHVAILAENLNVLQLLLTINDIDVNKHNAHLAHPLFYALCRNNDIADTMAKMLIQKDARIDADDFEAGKYGDTPAYTKYANKNPNYLENRKLLLYKYEALKKSLNP